MGFEGLEPEDAGIHTPSDSFGEIDTGDGEDTSTETDADTGSCPFECLSWVDCYGNGGYNAVDFDCLDGEICCFFGDDSDTGSADTDSDTDPESETDTGTGIDTDTGPEPVPEFAAYSEEECSAELAYEYQLAAVDSNDLSSPAVARRWMELSMAVMNEIRPQAFFNYYTFDYGPPDLGYLEITADLLPLAGDDLGSFALQLGVRAQPVTNEDRRLLNLVISIDTSSSMGGSPIERLKAVCTAIAGNLKAGDTVSITKWSYTSAVLLEPHEVNGPDDPDLVSAIDGIVAGGSTNLLAGLNWAYDEVEANLSPSSANRVVLITDGMDMAGINEIELIEEKAEDSIDQGIYLVGVGVGDGYNDTLLDEVTRAGKGPHVFVDTVDEAGVMFGDPTRFISTFEVAAREVTLDLVAPAGWYLEQLHGPPDTPPLPTGEPQYLWANEELIFHYLVVPCGEQDPWEADEFSATVNFTDTTSPYWSGFDTLGFSFSDFTDVPSDQVIKGRAVWLYAKALERIQPLLWIEVHYEAALQIIDETRTAIQEASVALGGDDELEDIDALLETYGAFFE